MSTPSTGPTPDAVEESETDAPIGGSETTEEQLEADNPVEEDTIKALDGEAPSG